MTRRRAYLLSHSNISLAEVNELDTGRPQPAPQTISMRSFPLFPPSSRSLTCLKTAISLKARVQVSVIKQQNGHPPVFKAPLQGHAEPRAASARP